MGERSLCCGNILTLWRIDNVVNLAEVRTHHSVFGINSLTFSHEMRVCKYFRKMHHMLLFILPNYKSLYPLWPPAWFNTFLLLFVIVSLENIKIKNEILRKGRNTENAKKTWKLSKITGTGKLHLKKNYPTPLPLLWPYQTFWLCCI